MKLICATPADNIDSGGPRKLSGGAGCFDAKLLDGVEAGLHSRDPTTKAVDHGYAVEVHFRRANFHAIGTRATAADDSRRQIEKLRNLALIERQVMNAERVLDVRNLGSLCIDGRRGPRYL